MTREELEAALLVKFPKIQRDKSEVKSYLTLRAAAPEEILPLLRWLKEERGFAALHMLTAVDWKGSVSLAGFIKDPNFNVFLPGEPQSQVDPPQNLPNNDYRDKLELVYALSNFRDRLMLFVKLDVPRSGGRAPSLVGLFPGADWQEREVYDLFGVEFSGHPNLKKILTPDFLEGHPLLKDYAHKKDRFD